MNTTIYFGPPGTGKTDTLLNIVETELARGVAPNKIAYVSFTRKAAQEARDRSTKKFKFNENDFPYFKTLHSIAYHELRLHSGDIISNGDLSSLGNALGLEFSGKFSIEDGPGKALGDKLLFIAQLARAKKISIKKQYDELSALDEVDWFALKQFSEAYSRYKEHNMLLDFSDMLDAVEDEIPATILIVDEAQDLCLAQWDFIDRVFASVEHRYIAGDDDQTIYRWGGADVEKFLSISGEKIILKKSHRLPKNIHSVANGITRKISRRQEKEFAPDDRAGIYAETAYPEEIDMSKGSWLLLARNGYMLNHLRNLVERKGHIYSIRGNKSVLPSHFDAIKNWEHLRKGNPILGSDALKMFDFIARKKPELDRNKMYRMSDIVAGNLGPWFSAFDAMPETLRDYYRATLKNGEKPSDTPRITISTIHGAKGAEADNVVLLTDVSRRVYNSAMEWPDDEHRVFYVGATRAKNALYVIEPQTQYNYRLV